jgi:hypothetical protein
MLASQDFVSTAGCGNGNIKKTAQHFVPRLVAPIYGHLKTTDDLFGFSSFLQSS